MHDSKKYNYFFSYSRDIYDEIASLLIKNIEEYSLRLWVDKTDVLLGSNINLSIHKVLEDVKTWNGAIVLLDKSYFKDRVLARTALKCGQILKYLPMYQNDEKMVRLSLS